MVSDAGPYCSGLTTRSACMLLRDWIRRRFAASPNSNRFLLILNVCGYVRLRSYLTMASGTGLSSIYYSSYVLVAFSFKI